jgi:RNA polymerase sigma-70 factor (ECF subfamily)
VQVGIFWDPITDVHFPPISDICKVKSSAQQIWNELNYDLEKYICSKVNHEDHCNDILHDVYLKLVANVEKVATVDNVKGYLVRIASNTIADHYRTLRNDSLDEPDGSVSNISADCCYPSATLSESFLNEVIGQLPPKYREAFVKIEIEGLTQQSYAASAGISLSGAKSRIQRAREQLKELILQCCEYQFDRYGNIVKCCGEDLD